MYQTGGNKMVKLVDRPQAAPATETAINPLQDASLNSERFLHPARLSEVVSQVAVTILGGARVTTLQTAPDAGNGLGRGMGLDKILDRPGITSIQGERFATAMTYPAGTEPSTYLDEEPSRVRYIAKTGETSIHLN
jgi:hypothetical protein